MMLKSICLQKPRYDYRHNKCGEITETILFAIKNNIFDVFYLCKKCNTAIIDKNSTGIIDHIKNHGLKNVEIENRTKQKYIMGAY